MRAPAHVLAPAAAIRRSPIEGHPGMMPTAHACTSRWLGYHSMRATARARLRTRSAVQNLPLPLSFSTPFSSPPPEDGRSADVVAQSQL
eukprot:5630813-Pyramimonas_sp.AAC.1